MTDHRIRGWPGWQEMVAGLVNLGVGHIGPGRVVARRDGDLWKGCRAMAGQLALGFGGLLRQLRAEAGLTQEELAEAASLSPRSVSDLERGINATARKQTAQLLADALGLTGPQRAHFEATARGRSPEMSPVSGSGSGGGSAAATRTLPRDISGFTGRAAELARLTAGQADTASMGGVV